MDAAEIVHNPFNAITHQVVKGISKGLDADDDYSIGGMRL